MALCRVGDCERGERWVESEGVGRMVGTEPCHFVMIIVIYSVTRFSWVWLRGSASCCHDTDGCSLPLPQPQVC